MLFFDTHSEQYFVVKDVVLFPKLYCRNVSCRDNKNENCHSWNSSGIRMFCFYKNNSASTTCISSTSFLNKVEIGEYDVISRNE